MLGHIESRRDVDRRVKMLKPGSCRIEILEYLCAVHPDIRTAETEEAQSNRYLPRLDTIDRDLVPTRDIVRATAAFRQQ